MPNARVNRALAVCCTVLPLLLNIWVVIPAPAEAPALLAVGLSAGWSVWLSLVAVIGCAVATRVHWAWMIVGFSAAACGMAPTVAAYDPGFLFPSALTATLEGHVTRPPQTLTYNTVDGQALLLDVYQPEESAPSRPLIVIHGGGWRARDKSDFPSSNHWFTQRGFTVFDIQYRLSPQPNWASTVGDVLCAIGFVKQRAAQFNIDPGRLVLVGRSAGAHLAMMAAYAQGHPRLPPACEAPDTRVHDVVAFYGASDLAYGYAHPANPWVYDSAANLRRFLGGTPEEVPELYALMSPLNHVSRDSPRTLLLHGDHDQYVRPVQTQFMDEKLTALGVEHRAVVIPYGQHGFDFMVDGIGAQIANDAMEIFLETR